MCARSVSVASVLLVAVAILAARTHAANYEAEVQRIADSLAESLQGQAVNVIAVADFTDLQGATTELGRFLAEEVSSAIVANHPAFSIADRRNLRRILSEHGLNYQEGLIDQSTAKELGKLAGVDAILVGTLTPLEESVRVSIQAISTETAMVVGAARGDVAQSPAIQTLQSRSVSGEASAAAPTASIRPDSSAAFSTQVSTDPRGGTLVVLPKGLRRLNANSVRLVLQIQYQGSGIASIWMYSPFSGTLVDNEGQVWEQRESTTLTATDVLQLHEQGPATATITFEAPSASKGSTFALTLPLNLAWSDVSERSSTAKYATRRQSTITLTDIRLSQ